MKLLTKANHRPALTLFLSLTTTVPLMGIQECNSSQDQDGDGYTTAQGDCDDLCPTCFPGGTETCDAQDNNCDGTLDEGLDQTWYIDNDSDGYGVSTQTATACAQPVGYAPFSGDCNASDATIHPNAAEACDGIDSNCDGNVDVGLEQTFYIDLDGDGWGTDSQTEVGCTPSQGFVAQSGDCNDGSSSVHPQAPEDCDSIDSNCDGMPEQGTYFVDQDGDGFGRSDVPVVCTPGGAVSPARGDCNDANTAIHPGASDLAGDGLDSDCGGTDKPEPHVGLGASSTGSLAQALQAATPGITLFVGPGTHPAAGLNLDGLAIALVSTHLAAATTLDGQGQGRILEVTSGESPDTLIDGFTFTGGRATLEGGAVVITDSSPTLRGCVFTHNQVSGNAATGQEGRGGALSLTRSDSLLDNLVFESNRVGGCFDSTSTSSVYWEDPSGYESRNTTTVVDTTTCFGGMGGALAILEGAPLLEGLRFRSNAVEGEGGGLFIQDAMATVTGSTFEQNRAHSACTLASTREDVVYSMGYGYQENSSTDTQTQTCTRPAGGGALRSLNATLTLDDVTFSTNQATPACLVLVSSSNTSNSYGDYWAQNRTDPACLDSLGGAVSALSTTFSGTGLSFEDNAASSGGALFAQQGTLSLAQSHLELNDAVLVTLSAQTTSSYSQSSQSELFGGLGGAIRLNGGSATLSGMTFLDNAAALNGGGIFSDGSNVTIGESTLEGQIAASALSYAASACDGCSTTQSSTTTGGKGGALFVKGGRLSLHHTRIMDSSALNGAGLYLAAPSTLEHVLLAQGLARGSENSSVASYYSTRTDTRTPSGGRGAGLTLEGATASLTHVVIAANLAEDMTSVSTTSPPTAPDIQTPSTDNGKGGGIYAVNGASSPAALTLSHSIISHNGGPGLEVASGTASPSYTLFYAQPGEQAHTLSSLGATNLVTNPQFYQVDSFGLPVDFHLSTTSPAIHAGDPSLHNVDGSQADLGLYGGTAGDGFDLDGDARPDYFWPGAFSAAPAGYSSSDYDCDDQDALVTFCSP